MAGIIYPINRLDYDFEHEGGYFSHIESSTDRSAQWLETYIHGANNSTPSGYDPSRSRISILRIQRLSQTGKIVLSPSYEKMHQLR
jgi:hypothetical protein